MLRRRALDWLLTLGGSWHPARVQHRTLLLRDEWRDEWRGHCRCGWRTPWYWVECAAQEHVYDHQGLGGRT